MSKVAEYIQNSYLDDGKNCAEAMLCAALYSRGRELSEEGSRMMIGFGGGCSSGSVCGAIVGGVAAIGCLLGGDTEEETERCKEAANRFFLRCKDAFSAVDCDAIKPVYRREETRCLLVVERTAEILETVLSEYSA